jgi:hypothetical protein
MFRTGLKDSVGSSSNVTAARFTVSMQTLRRMAATSLISCVRLSSRNWRFQEGLNRFIRSQSL